ncbi:MAG: DUF4342 domain-containing protein [Dethiobacteria bacterium]|jgi:hypothetical protein
MTITLDLIDKVRERAGVSYTQARYALEKVGGNPVDALVLLEEEKNDHINTSSSEATDFLFDKGENDTFQRLKTLFWRSYKTKICVRARENTLVEIPLTAGIIGALLFPKWTAWGFLGLLAGRCSLGLKRH